MAVSSRQGPTDGTSAGCRACTLGENLLLMKFKMAIKEYSRMLFSHISQLIKDIET